MGHPLVGDPLYKEGGVPEVSFCRIRDFALATLFQRAVPAGSYCFDIVLELVMCVLDMSLCMALDSRVGWELKTRYALIHDQTALCRHSLYQALWLPGKLAGCVLSRQPLSVRSGYKRRMPSSQTIEGCLLEQMRRGTLPFLHRSVLLSL